MGLRFRATLRRSKLARRSEFLEGAPPQRVTAQHKVRYPDTSSRHSFSHLVSPERVYCAIQNGPRAFAHDRLSFVKIAEENLDLEFEVSFGGKKKNSASSREQGKPEREFFMSWKNVYVYPALP